MNQLRVDLIDTLNDRRLKLKLPDDVPLERLVPALARKLGLPEGAYVLAVEGAAWAALSQAICLNLAPETRPN